MEVRKLWATISAKTKENHYPSLSFCTEANFGPRMIWLKKKLGPKKDFVVLCKYNATFKSFFKGIYGTSLN